MKILITGAGGMLGSDLAEAFQKSFDVTGIGRNPAPHLAIRYHLQDLHDEERVGEIFAAAKPHVVFHTAAMTQVDDCEKDPRRAYMQNVELTKVVADHCNKAGALLVFFSTDYVFDGLRQGEYTEEDEPNPPNVYAATKLAAEKWIRDNSQRFTIFRISWLYGLRGKSFPRTVLDRGRDQKKFKIVDDQIGRPTFTRDLAVYFERLLKRAPEFPEALLGQTFHLANEGKVSWASFARFLFKEAGMTNVEVENITSGQLDRPAQRPANSVLSLRKAATRLGQSMRPWEEAAREFVRHYQQSVKPTLQP